MSRGRGAGGSVLLAVRAEDRTREDRELVAVKVPDYAAAARNLSEAAVVSIGPDGARRLVAGANLDSRGLQERMPQAALVALQAARKETP